VWLFGIAWPWTIFGRRRIVQISGWGPQLRTVGGHHPMEIPARAIAGWNAVSVGGRTTISLRLRDDRWRMLTVRGAAGAAGALAAARRLSRGDGYSGRPVVESCWLSLGLLLAASTVYVFTPPQDHWLGLPEVMAALPLLALLVRRGEGDISAYERHALTAALLVVVCLDLFGFAGLYSWIGQHDRVAFNDSVEAQFRRTALRADRRGAARRTSALRNARRLCHSPELLRSCSSSRIWWAVRSFS
jgi:hypothetical protein